MSFKTLENCKFSWFYKSSYIYR